MELFADDEDEEAIPAKAWEEGWDGPEPVQVTIDETEKAFNDYLENSGDNDDEVTYFDLTKEEQRIVDEAFEDDELQKYRSGDSLVLRIVCSLYRSKLLAEMPGAFLFPKLWR